MSIPKCRGFHAVCIGHRFHKEGRLASKQEVFDLAHPMITHALACFGTYGSCFLELSDGFGQYIVGEYYRCLSDVVAAYDPDAFKTRIPSQCQTVLSALIEK